MELKGNQKCLLTNILQNNFYDPLKKEMHAGLEQHKVFSPTIFFPKPVKHKSCPPDFTCHLNHTLTCQKWMDLIYQDVLQMLYWC